MIYGITTEQYRHALRLGYDIQINTKNGARFSKNARHIWSTHNGYQTADLIEGKYTNHQKFDNITDAIKRD